MKKNIIYIILASFLLVSFIADQFTLEKTIPSKAEFITTDNLGNCYAVTGSILEKYDSKGTLLKTYSNKKYGKIKFIDATNPLKILIFYNNFQQLSFLDNMLAEQNTEPVSIENLGYPQTTLACTSHNDGFWIYNQQNMELLRFDQESKLTIQTGNISQLSNTKIQPDYLIEHNNKVYLNNPATGILVFDVFGAYLKTIPLTGLKKFQVKEDEIFYTSTGKTLNKFNTKILDETTISLPDSCSNVCFEKNKLYVLRGSGISIYTVK